MLYDPSKEKQFVRDVFSLEGFIGWLETSSPETKYNYSDTKGCLLVQYFSHSGFNVFSLACDGFSTHNEKGRLVDNKFPYSFERAVLPTPHTFGAALSRARKELALRACAES